MAQQMSIFDFMYEKYKPKRKLRIIELFAGVGSQYKALKEITKNTDYEVKSYKICEWAVPSIKAYNSIHIKDTNDYSINKTYQEMLEKVKMVSLNYNSPITDKQIKTKGEAWVRDVYNNIVATHNLVNIMEVKGSDLEIVDTDKYDYIMTYSFPCQDLSKAGTRKGADVSQADGGTRSGLLWEVERILTELDHEHRPQMLLMENVPDLIEKNFIHSWHKWLEKLDQLGYMTYVDVLNAKDYAIPQNRKRVFAISIKTQTPYTFPNKIGQIHTLEDFLEGKVDKRYYLTEKMLNGMLTTKFHQYQLENRIQDTTAVVDTLTTATGSRCPHLIDMEHHYSPESIKRIRKNIIKKDYSNALTANSQQSVNHSNCALIVENNGGGLKVRNNNSKGYSVAKSGDGVDISGRMRFHRGTVQKQSCQSITTMGGNDIGVVVKNEE